MSFLQQLPVIKDANILMVGAGGIGCELLKSLVLSGFQNIHIIDMDTIEVSNLNRQFLFRQCHVGQSKAKVARDAVMRFRTDINITPYHANVKDPEFTVEFFKQFNVVLNGLDNLEARRHVNRLCLAAEVPLVESGTTGFLGQVTVHVKGKTDCYECYPKPTARTYPVCTITSTPSKFVHCIVWAKDLLFAKLFGNKNKENDLNGRASEVGTSETTADAFERMENEDFEQYGKRIYDHVFGYNTDVALSNPETWRNRKKPKPIYIKDVISHTMKLPNGSSSHHSEVVDPSSISAMASLGFKNPQEVWGLEENTQVFLQALKFLFLHREREIGNLSFDKDDQLAVEFVTSAANIRASSFGIPLCSLFESKGIAGNIVHAVATTNAIIAGLIVIEAIKILKKDSTNYRFNRSSFLNFVYLRNCLFFRTTYSLEHPNRKLLLMPVEPFEPYKSCYVCSNTPLTLEINTKRSKLRDFVEKIVKAKLGMHSPIIMNGSTILYEVGDDLEDDIVSHYAANFEKIFNNLPAPVTDGTSISVEDLQQEFTCNINVKHRDEFDEEKEPDEMALYGWLQTPLENDGGKENGVDAVPFKAEVEGDGNVEEVSKKRKVCDVEICEVDTEVFEVGKMELIKKKKMN